LGYQWQASLSPVAQEPPLVEVGWPLRMVEELMDPTTIIRVGWQPVETWVEEEGCYPNDLVLVLVEVSDKSTNCLVDQVQGTRYVTMGHWYPEIELSDGTKEEGHWEYVGWDWCQDCFVGTQYDKVVAWQPLPSVQP